jgi:spore maturation protein SpmB
MHIFMLLLMESGRSAVELSFFLILPIMVLMMAVMKLLDGLRVLDWTARVLSGPLAPVGLPGLGVFAILQMLFVSFAAPVSTLKLMDEDGTLQDARIGATLAAILVMSQANAAFPLAAVGLHLPASILSSLLGGVLAGFLAFRYLEFRHRLEPPQSRNPSPDALANGLGRAAPAGPRARWLTLLFQGGEEGMWIAIKSLPPLVLTLFLMNVLRRLGIIGMLEHVSAPVLRLIGIPAAAVLPLVTKYVAGGTAMVGITIEAVQGGALSAVDLNRIAGFALNPLDPVGLAVLAAAGPRVGRLVKPVLGFAAIGILLRGIIHLVLF